jgi:hypothetical protein
VNPVSADLLQRICSKPAKPPPPGLLPPTGYSGQIPVDLRQPPCRSARLSTKGHALRRRGSTHAAVAWGGSPMMATVCACWPEARLRLSDQLCAEHLLGVAGKPIFSMRSGPSPWRDRSQGGPPRVGPRGAILAVISDDCSHISGPASPLSVGKPTRHPFARIPHDLLETAAVMAATDRRPDDDAGRTH